MTRDDALESLMAVVPVVAGETVKSAQRARLLRPWVDQCRQQGLSWRDLVEPLAPLCSLDDRAKTETRLSQLFAVTGKRSPKTSVEYGSWQARIAAAAGVDLPGSARTADDAPSAHKLVAQLVQSNMDLAAALAANAARPMAARPVVTLTTRTTATPAAATIPASATNPSVPRVPAPTPISSMPSLLPSPTSEADVMAARKAQADRKKAEAKADDDGWNLG